MAKVVLFDFDGTLADSFENFLGIVGIISEKYCLPTLSRQELESLRREDARTLVRKLNIPFYKIPFIARDMKRLQHEGIDGIKPFSGIPQVLGELKNRGYVLGIITSNGMYNVQTFLRANDINIFDHICCDASIFGKDKVISKFLSQNKIKKEDATYVGDEMRDIQACQKVGIRVISVTWGFNTRDGLVSLHPDYLINSPKELLSILHTKHP